MDIVDELLFQWREERPDLDVSALGIAIRIEMLAKKLNRHTSNSLATVGLKNWEYDVLSALRRQGQPYQLPSTELARNSLLSAGAMTTRIDQLEEKKLVKRRPDPADRRGVLVELSGKGVKIVDQAIETRLDAADEAITSLNSAQRKSAEKSLRLLLNSGDF